MLRCVVLEDVQWELGGARVRDGRVEGVMRAEEVMVGPGEVDAVDEGKDDNATCRGVRMYWYQRIY